LWYDNIVTNIRYWNMQGQANTSFVSMFRARFTTARQKNKWHYELSNIKQMTNESIDTYSARFNNLKRLVDPGDHLPDDYEIRLFLNGLKPNIAARVAIADPGNLRTAVNKARATEAGTYYMRESPQATNNNAIEALTKQME